MNKVKALIEFEISDDDLADIICGAYEGGQVGMGCWFCSTEVIRNDDLGITSLTGFDFEMQEGDDVPEMIEAHVKRYGSLWVINKETVLKGIPLALADPNCSRYMRQAFGSELNLGAMDCGDYDTIIQFGLFGKAVYG